MSFNVFFFDVMPIAGIEPVTCALRMRCSTNWAKSADWGWASPIETKNFQKRSDGQQTSVYRVEGIDRRPSDVPFFHEQTFWERSSRARSRCSYVFIRLGWLSPNVAD